MVTNDWCIILRVITLGSLMVRFKYWEMYFVTVSIVCYHIPFGRPNWVSLMHRLTGIQDVAGSILGSGHISFVEISSLSNFYDHSIPISLIQVGQYRNDP